MVGVVLGVSVTVWGGSERHAAAARGSSGMGRGSPQRPGISPLRTKPPTAVAHTVQSIPGYVFGIVIARNGWIFASRFGAPGITARGGEVIVFRLHGVRLHLERVVALPAPAVAGEALTNDGRFLLVAGGHGAFVLDVAALERHAGRALLGSLNAPPSGLGDDGPIELALTRDGRYVFLAEEWAKRIVAFDLRKSVLSKFRKSLVVASFHVRGYPTGLDVVDSHQKLLVVAASTQPGAQGELLVVDMRRLLERRPPRIFRIPAGRDPARVAASPHNSVIWVTARGSDRVLAFSNRCLQGSCRSSLVTSVGVGADPIDIAFAERGRLAVVADSARSSLRSTHGDLRLLDTQLVLRGRPSIAGVVPTRRFPRSLAVRGDGSLVLVADFDPGAIEVIRLRRLS